MASQFALNMLQELAAKRVTYELSSTETKTPGAGGHRFEGSTSFAAILATLIPVVLFAVLYVVAFLLLRQRYRNIYVPRTYLGIVPEKDRTPASSRGILDWVHEFRDLDIKFVLRHNSLDAYLFLRFFKTIILICFVGCCLTWPILIPVNATGGGDATQLDRISFSNINDSNRLYAHAVVAWLFLGFIIVLVARERLFLIGLRQAYLLSKPNASRLSSRVVLFLSVPDEAIQENHLSKVFGPDAVRSWLVTNIDKLKELVDNRNQEAMKLEGAQVELCKKANSRRWKNRNANGTSQRVSEEDLPMHRMIPIVGSKVNIIEASRNALLDIAPEIEEHRKPPPPKHHDHSMAIFVEFRTQGTAHRAVKQIQYHNPLKLQPRYVGVLPKEVLWQNLTIGAADRISRGYVATAFVVATILLWSIPIGSVAAISNINYLTDKIHFLRYINNLPSPVLGFITGFLPPYIMSEFVSYVPKFFRDVAKRSGEPTLSQAELRTQNWYFAFQVIQVFLVTTISSGAAAVATKIAQEPMLVPTLLAENLPKASNFYLSYFILQGFASSTNQLLNYSDLLEYIAYDKFFDKTPRDQYTRYTRMKGIRWGSVYPKFANMAVIAIAYSCVAPLMLGFATIGMYLLYLAYKYQLLYVVQTKVETKGESYGKALQHMLTGVYLAELFLFGLCTARKATGPAVLSAILFAGTVLHHLIMNQFLDPLEHYLPSDMQDAETEDVPLLAAEEGTSREESAYAEGPGKGFVELLPRFVESHLYDSCESLKAWFHHPSNLDEDIPSYTDEQIQTAYLNPALTSKAPKLWLAKDELGISKKEVEENEKSGITSTDDGASLGPNNKIEWNHDDITQVPIFKLPVRY